MGFNITNLIFYHLKSWEIGGHHFFSNCSRGPNLEETHFSHVVPWGQGALADRILGANFFWGENFIYKAKRAVIKTPVGSVILGYYTTIWTMDVSGNSGTPKSSFLIGFSIINHPFWGTMGYHYFWKHLYTTQVIKTLE